MKTMRLALLALALAGLAACEGGGVDLNVANTDNSTDNSGGGGGGDDEENPCAAYTPPDATEEVQGDFDGTNCVYGSDFVGQSNPLLVDLTIPLFTGKHVFEDSLFVGEDISTGAAPAAGEGPTLTIEAGNTLVFRDSADYVLINRGSRIVAEGTSTEPITFTSFTDAINDIAGANDVSQWGGIVINGNGITNNCTDADRAGDTCHVVAEGQPSHYGGDDNEEDSGILRYVVVKHTGFEVTPDSELNGITFNAVGSGTVVENVQTYSTFDDGFEMFGGAVNLTNVIALYSRDDSLDYSDGYVGTITNALIIHYRSDGNRCIEGDNVGSARSDAGVPLDTAPLTTPTILNVTCITGNSDVNTHGDSEGALARQGGQLRLENSIIYGGYGFAVSGFASNECLEVESTVSLDAAAAGPETFQSQNNVIACQEAVKGTLSNGDALTEWFLGASPSTNGADYSFNAGNFQILDLTSPSVRVLVPGTFYTSATIVDEFGTTVVADASGLGAVRQIEDWTSPWAFGLDPDNADEPLWFAP